MLVLVVLNYALCLVRLPWTHIVLEILLQPIFFLFLSTNVKAIKAAAVVAATTVVVGVVVSQQQEVGESNILAMMKRRRM